MAGHPSVTGAAPSPGRPAAGEAGVASAPAAQGATTAVTGRHLPALDGLRAIAVAGVIAYHLGFGWAQGGYLGVDLFFVLSGFLITSLLLEEWVATERIRLRAFWGRRVRRLMPALFLLLLAIALFVVLDGRFGAPGAIAQIDLSGLRGDALATLFYVANWHAIFAHQSYFAQFAAPSPLEHTWSLAIEEQFYLVWPPFLLLLCSQAGRRFRRVGLTVTLLGVGASAVAMALLDHGVSDPTRVYFGTDTRAFDLLCGAALAMLAAARPQPGERARRWLHAGAVPAAVALGFVWVVAGSPGGLPPRWMFEGGFLLCALLATVVIADVRQLHLGPLGHLLALRPLQWIGRISYGIYLWHWPVIVYLTSGRTGLAEPWLDVARVVLTVGLAAASFYLVEMPVRRRRFAGWRRWATAPACAAALAGVVLLATTPAIAAPAPTAQTSAPVTITTMKQAHRSTGKSTGAGFAVDTAVPGAGGFTLEAPIRLVKGTVISRRHPLRVMVIGDSIMVGAELGFEASLGSTHEVTVSENAIDGFGLSTDWGWRSGLPRVVAQARPALIIAAWSWDESCSSYASFHKGPCALQDPVGYRAELEHAVRLMLGVRGVEGIIFLQLPPGAASVANGVRAGLAAWTAIEASLPAAFPGKVMYLPVGASLLWQGHFSSWLPPAGEPNAPSSQWERVRMVDNVHMCPAGVVRYSDAVLADMTALFGLPAPAPDWWRGSWTRNETYNSPPGACPADHPPS
jgi:peptidoglycan/LPS O-acetylase OafA/YrhL